MSDDVMLAFFESSFGCSGPMPGVRPLRLLLCWDDDDGYALTCADSLFESDNEFSWIVRVFDDVEPVYVDVFSS
jgi:hypothetical protein